jgi:hypothetical protein
LKLEPNLLELLKNINNGSLEDYKKLFSKKDFAYLIVKAKVKRLIKDEDNITNIGLSLIDVPVKKETPFLEEWLSLWPTKLIIPLNSYGSYRVSGNTTQCKSRMIKFRKQYPQFSDEEILQATKNYIDRKQRENWEYVKKNVKFIYDRNTSELYNELIALSEVEEDNDTFTQIL